MARVVKGVEAWEEGRGGEVRGREGGGEGRGGQSPRPGSGDAAGYRRQQAGAEEAAHAQARRQAQQARRLRVRVERGAACPAGASPPMRSALSIERSSSSRLGNVRKISLLGKGLCRNTPQLRGGAREGGRRRGRVSAAQPGRPWEELRAPPRLARPRPGAAAPAWAAPDLVESLPQQRGHREQVVVVDPNVVGVGRALLHDLLGERLSGVGVGGWTAGRGA